jgi:hypothetical protein
VTKASGITTSVTVDDAAGAGKDLSNDITSFTVGTPRGSQEITGLDKSAVERILLLADGTISMTGIFNASTADKSHDVFKTVPTQSGTGTGATRTIVIVYPGTKTLTMECILTDYSLARGDDGSLVWTVAGSLANGTAPTWS